MKNLKLVIALFLVITVSSCTKDEVAIEDESVLVGTWEEKSSTTITEPAGFAFNADGTGSWYYYSKGVKSDPVKLTYEFYEKTMELKIFWINMPHWDNPTDMIEIRNGNILIYDGFTYYKK